MNEAIEIIKRIWDKVSVEDGELFYNGFKLGENYECNTTETFELTGKAEVS